MERINERVVRGPEEPKDKTVTWIYTENGSEEVKKKYIDGEWTEVGGGGDKFTIDDVINFYTNGKIKKLNDLNVLLTKNYRITTSAAAPDEVWFPYMGLADYTDDMQGVSDMLREIDSIATEGYFLMKYDERTNAGCLCMIDDDRINFICPINNDAINAYLIDSDTMVINEMLF